MKKFCVLLLIAGGILSARTDIKREPLVTDRDFGPIVYAEDYYRLYSLPLYYNEEDLLNNVAFLQRAIEAPNDFVNRSLCIVETEKQYTKYKDVLQMQFNYLITQNLVFLAGLYDKEHYYFYNDQFKEDISNSLAFARYYYKEAEKYWQTAVTFAVKVSKNNEKLGLDMLVDEAKKIRYGDIDYSKTIRRRLKAIDGMLAAIQK
ncbi:MAG: hypothetical protein HZC28_00940 [Spirochaetes bacterium]|nr:hypothetical protein [Spirochaetota bacterium]